MADKRIVDLSTLDNLNDDDLIPVSSNSKTYSTKISTLKKAASEVANSALQAANDAKAQAQAAQTQAAQAMVTARNAEDDAAAARQKASELDTKMNLMQDILSGKVDGAYVEDGYLYLTSDDEIVAGPLGPFSGTGGGEGGGGGSVNYTLTLKNLLDSRALTGAAGSPVYLSFSYTSVDEDGVDDGAGVGTLTINGTRAATLSIPQGDNLLDISSFLVSGSNNVKLKVENSEGLSRTLSYTVTLVELTLSTTFNQLAVYSGAVVFNYTVTGDGNKTVHFLIDGKEIGNEVVASSGRSRSYAIPVQTDGAHILTVYADVTVAGVSVRSETLALGMLWISESMSAPAVLSTFSLTEATQGDILTIPYLAYDPLAESASVELSVLSADGTIYSTQRLTVGRTTQEWAVQNYPIGEVTFRITCGTAVFQQKVTVAELVIDVEPVTDALALHFDPTGRSNYEDTPATWTDGNVSAAFNGIGFAGADGWLTDENGASIFRILPGGSMTIPYQLFASDARNAGATIEVEMATHNVRDYDTVVMSCLSGGRGFKIASQYAQLNSEASEISMQFKEDEKVRVSFVVEPRTLHRLIYVYVDGVMCGAIQYPADDNFEQSPAVGLTIGAEASGIDVYRIRLYTKGLTRNEILDNYIVDRSLLSERVGAAQRNNIFDLSDNIVITKLPFTLPYMLIKCAQLPQSKGDKQTCEIEYVNPSDTSRSFIAAGVEIDVQGTSSAGYKKKNFKWKLKKGLTYTANGQTSDTYLLRENSVPAKVFCMKADVASSEGANNVELVRLYDDVQRAVPYQTPPQASDSRVRVGIDGLPCVIFWQNTATNVTKFWGKYNFNFDKGAEDVFGFAPGCESWEFKNNTSSRVIFKSADFSGTGWQDDFEARYPDGSTDCSKLAEVCAWVASTDRSAVSSESDKAARLQKFKMEFEDHFVKAPTLFYYIFTEVFLMVDSRAKNMFLTSFDGGEHWQPIPYDFDTALGINNEGQLVFDYDLEDTDQVDGHNVFNGQESVLWCNVRDAFGDEITSMYQSLRKSGSLFDYAEVISRFSSHQAAWPEAVWNEDSWEKYLEPLENDNDSSYLTMLQGNKASQREWWLYNGFRYRDSKYQTGEAQNNFITLRGYNVANITVTPYSHIWPRVKYGSYTVSQRGKRNVPVTLACPLDSMDDTEIYIYSADRLAAIGDLSPLQVGYANFSMATKLQSLKLGDGASSYQNTRLTELYVGNNELLTSLDVRNCVNLTQTVDLSGCVGIEEVKASGSAVTGFTLPVGGKLKTLELPGSVTNLTLREQAQFKTLSMAGYSSLTTLRIENTPNIPVDTIISNASNLDRVRLINVEWTAASESSLEATIRKLESCKGMDASGNNTDAAVVTGRVNVPSISGDLLAEINDNFPQLVVVADGVPLYIVRYIDWDNTLLYRAAVSEGGSAVNPVTEGLISAPTREGTEDTGYAFKDFGLLPTDIHDNVTLIAQYEVTYRVLFYNVDAIYNTQWVVSGNDAANPSGTPTRPSTPANTFTFCGWSRIQNATTADDNALKNITAPTSIYAAYTITGRTYTVKFYNGTTLLQTVSNVPYGGTAKYTGQTPAKTGVTDPENYKFSGWSPEPTNIQGDTSCYAQFTDLRSVVIKYLQRSIDTYESDTNKTVAAYSFYNATALTSVKAPATSVEGYAFQGCSNLTKVELSGTAVATIAANAFNGLAKMDSLIIRSTTMSTLSNTSAFTGTKIAAGSGAIYVPESLVDTYKADTNWKNYFIASINDFPVTDFSTISDTWEQIFAAEADGTYATKYAVGDTKKITINGVEDYMQIVAIDTDDLSDGSGKAKITWLSKGLFATHRMNATSTTKDGWAATEMRSWLRDTILPTIDETIRNNIKEVNKTYKDYTSSSTKTIADTVWIPSSREIFGGTSYENEGCVYTGYFNGTARRIKYLDSSGAASSWWLRSANSSANFRCVSNAGIESYNNANGTVGVALGFCT